mmetsp:Transcript_9462/g.4973  ORF Transcript_9462/g.4973 Transcript_9462/m.4973 type:complete len:85 (+) Transcript_9462:125-379(+)
MGQKSLYNVLYALAVHLPDIGYCQGQGFIAALFLTYLDEEQTFSLMQWLLTKREMADIFEYDMPGVYRCFYIANALFRLKLKKL